MFKSKGLFHKLYPVGPGGWHCPCCAPAPKDRKKERRRIRKKINRLVNNLVEKENDML